VFRSRVSTRLFLMIHYYVQYYSSMLYGWYYREAPIAILSIVVNLEPTKQKHML
jgi:hypothetical protein